MTINHHSFANHSKVQYQDSLLFLYPHIDVLQLFAQVRQNLDFSPTAIQARQACMPILGIFFAIFTFFCLNFFVFSYFLSFSTFYLQFGSHLYFFPILFVRLFVFFNFSFKGFWDQHHFQPDTRGISWRPIRYAHGRKGKRSRIEIVGHDSTLRPSKTI